MLIRFFLIDFPVVVVLIVVLYFAYRLLKNGIPGATPLALGVGIIGLLTLFSNGTFIAPITLGKIYKIIFALSPVVVYVGYGLALYGFASMARRLLRYANERVS